MYERGCMRADLWIWLRSKIEGLYGVVRCGLRLRCARAMDIASSYVAKIIYRVNDTAENVGYEQRWSEVAEQAEVQLRLLSSDRHRRHTRFLESATQPADTSERALRL